MGLIDPMKHDGGPQVIKMRDGFTKDQKQKGHNDETFKRILQIWHRPHVHTNKKSHVHMLAKKKHRKSNILHVNSTHVLSRFLNI